MILRPYQLELVDAVWAEMFARDEALAQLPTGGGKTLCFSHLLMRAMEARPNVRCIVLMGRIDLVLQTERALARVIERRHIGVYCGSLNRREINRPIVVASIQSIAQVETPTFDLCIVDEAHNLDQEEGAYIKFIDKLRGLKPKLKIVGFTATPFRSDGVIYGDGKLFNRLCYRKGIQDMIAMGFLCRPILKQVEGAFDTSNLRIRAGEYMQEDVELLVSDEEVMRRQIAEAIEKMKGRIAIAWACANIAHCIRVMEALHLIGESATCVHSKQDTAVRASSLKSFIDGRVRHMVFVSILSEGFDHPPIDCIALMRPTRSPVLYVQTVGRGLRPSGGKESCLVLDYGQVVRELGPLDDPKVKGKKGEGEAVMKVCPKCSSWVFGGCRLCPDCGFEFPPPPAPEKKLTKRADDNAKILSDDGKPETEELGPIYITMHKARSGNDCVKITYGYGGMMNVWGERDGVPEFFVTNSPWAMQRLEQRLDKIGAQLPGIPFEGEVRVPGTFELVKAKDGKFWRVLSVKKISEKSFDGDEADTSFDFGANADQTAKVEF